MTKETIHIHITNDPMYVENGMIVYVRDGGPCWVIDPGLPPQAAEIVKHIREHKLELSAILLTHAHADHIAGIDEVRGALSPVPVHLGQQEWPALSDPAENLSAQIGAGFATKVDGPQDLPPGDTLTLDETEWKILDTAGHSPGGRSFYCAEHGIVIVGDALFQGSVGRVDFHHSDGETLMRNLHSHLMTLPDETRVLSGHGPETTIGHERATNPFMIHGL